MADWTSDRIRALRRHLGETTGAFGARFHRSGRSIEDWEQGRRSPDQFVRAGLDAIAKAERFRFRRAGGHRVEA